MALDPKILQQAIEASRVEQVSVPERDEAAVTRAVGDRTGRRRRENIFEAPAWVQKIPQLKSLVGTGQELAEFLTGVPRLFGVQMERPPQAVETGLGEKAGAGVLEYLLGGAGARAIPAVQRGIQAVRQIPAVGRALAAPITQRAVGAAALGALEQPERPVAGAVTGAAISPAVELGFKVPAKAVNFMARSKWSPFHSMMMPHIKREFNEFIDNTGKKIGLTTEHDVDKGIYDRLSGQYREVSEEASNLYDKASDAFKGIKYPVYWKEGLRGRTMPLIKDIRDTYEKSTDSFGIKINKTMKTLEEKIDDPVTFRRKIHSAERDAVKTGNIDLLESLEKVEKNFDQNLEKLAARTKDVQLSNALGALKDADTYFKENVVPFRKRTSVKLEEGKRKAIPTKFFRAHSKDSSKNLGKAISGDIQDLEHISKVSPEIKDYFAFNHLKKGFNDPETFIKEYSALTKEQKANIFSKDQISRFNKFKNIYDRNPAAFKESKSVIPTVAGIGGGITGLSSVLPFAGVTTPLSAGALAAGLGGLGALKGISKIPAVREAYLAGAPTIPTTTDAVRDIVMGALLGTTRE